MNRRRLLAVSMFMAPLVAAGIACTFPDATFGSGGGGDDGTEEAGSEGAVDGGSDVAVLPDVNALVDVATRDDANQVVDANVCATKPMCDCDGDGYLDKDCDAGPDAAGPGKLPGDCDDLDPLRHPGAPFTDAVPEGHDGDWNCNGKVERTPEAGIACSGLGATGCFGGPGFLSVPGCGTKSDFYSCEPSGLVKCQLAPKGQVTQLCK